MTGRVAGKVAFITGAARGVGRTHCTRLAEEGADIIAFDLCGPPDPVNPQVPPASDEDLAQTVKEVEARGGRIVARKGDVRDYEALQAAVNDGLEAFGHVDIVAANAGAVKVGSRTDQASQAEWDEMIGVNLTGVWNTVRATVPQMVAQGNGGSIVITSSSAGLKGVPLLGPYTAAKHGVVGLMRSLARELGEHSIRVNTIHPTGVDTPMGVNEAMFKIFRPELEHPTFEDFEPSLRAVNILPIAVIDPVDISNALLFLASDEARYITGVALPVDAGTTAK